MTMNGLLRLHTKRSLRHTRLHSCTSTLLSCYTLRMTTGSGIASPLVSRPYNGLTQCQSHGCAEMCSSAIALCMLPVNCYSSSSSPSSLPPVNSSFASSGSSSSSIFGSAICVTSFMGLHRWRLFRVPVSSCVPRPRSTSPCCRCRRN